MKNTHELINILNFRIYIKTWRFVSLCKSTYSLESDGKWPVTDYDKTMCTKLTRDLEMGLRNFLTVNQYKAKAN